MSSAWVGIETRAAFCAFIAECGFEGPDLCFVIHPDGSFAGTSDGVAFEGRWEWQDGFFCRTLSLPDAPDETDCEHIEVNGAQMRYTRDRGQGEAHVVRKVPL
ncbi:hypothetical protein M3P21_12415 [Ruegeria sp. 2012CJ41-6]|uniref:Uncharacterized protein n=1 Tax=Ruegeria spongiae TaxID=2942209 RepID=A0ABT0Q3C4_9RHOB|nr:hypothetical protein [Ruegeria spongiae]MCL6284330.1 hypothetical protein [Ruegeria spongiae]